MLAINNNNVSTNEPGNSFARGNEKVQAPRVCPPEQKRPPPSVPADLQTRGTRAEASSNSKCEDLSLN
jgi:hypothetical protein